MLRKLISIVLLLSLLCSIAFSVSADSLSWFSTDETTGWHICGVDKTNYLHMGSKTTTYTYASVAAKSALQSSVEGGIDLWGSYISCNESNSLPVGTIALIPNAGNFTARAAIVADDNDSNHVGEWILQVNSINFQNCSTAGQKRTIAHEIGHVYGLDHISNEDQIMYHTYSEDKNVTANDRNGMKVMTHVHTHSNVNYDRVMLENNYHEKRCPTCKLYVTARCTFTERHSGRYHYYEFNCECGRLIIERYACTGSPCVKIY